MVVSVILYNCSSWSAPKNVLKKLDTCHRRHLRSILNVKWPATITNTKLYDICKTTCLSDRVKLSRWSMLGHILRSPENSLAALSLLFAVIGSKVHKGRKGAHKTNLLKIIREDLKTTAINDGTGYHTLSLNNQNDIDKLRSIAQDRKKWKETFYCRTVL